MLQPDRHPLRRGRRRAALLRPEDTFNFAIGQYHLRPLKRTQISGIAHYELTDRVEAYGEVYYINSENSYQQASDSFTPVTPGAGASTFLVPNYATNPILLPAVRQFFINNTALFDPDGDGTAAGLGRRAPRRRARLSQLFVRAQPRAT